MPRPKAEPDFAQKQRDDMVINIDKKTSKLDEHLVELEDFMKEANKTTRKIATNSKNLQEKCNEVILQNKKTNALLKRSSEISNHIKMIKDNKKSLKNIRGQIKNSQGSCEDDGPTLKVAQQLLNAASELMKEHKQPMSKEEKLIETTKENNHYMEEAIDSLKQVKTGSKSSASVKRTKQDDGSTTKRPMQDEEATMYLKQCLRLHLEAALSNTDQGESSLAGN